MDDAGETGSEWGKRIFEREEESEGREEADAVMMAAAEFAKTD